MPWGHPRSGSAPRPGPTRPCSPRAGTRPTRTRPRSGWPTTPRSSRWSRSTPPTTRRRPSRPRRCGRSARRPDFVFNIKAFSLLTGHPTKVSALYKDLRPETDKTNVYPDDLPPRRTSRSGSGSCPRSTRWSRRASSARCCSSSRRGSPSAAPTSSTCWRSPSAARPLRVAVEFRHESWFDGDNQQETLDFLRRARPAVRLRRHAAGPQVVDPAGARRHRRPGRGALPRAQRQVDEQGHLREVRLPVLPRGS